MIDLAALRREYSRARLDLEHTDADPVRQFAVWMTEARTAAVPEPTAMTLATADASGSPDARIVLLKGADARGFVFFTDYRSSKGRQLTDNPRAALTFWWGELERQVRIRGTVARLTQAESGEYFRTRPRDSQISAWTSEQSRIVADRATLDAAWAAIEARFAGGEVPLPPHWGGFCLAPLALEFWQGRPGRFHDRIHYTRASDGAWHRERLSP